MAAHRTRGKNTGGGGSLGAQGGGVQAGSECMSKALGVRVSGYYVNRGRLQGSERQGNGLQGSQRHGGPG